MTEFDPKETVAADAETTKMAMETPEIDRLLSKLDGRGTDAEYAAVEALSKLGTRFPELLLRRYREASSWGARASCVYHAVKWAKFNDHAFRLGIEATQDRSKKVRYRACMLLAVAQREAALSALDELLNDSDSRGDASAAIDAIRNGNQDLFVDRDRTGKMHLSVAAPAR